MLGDSTPCRTCVSQMVPLATYKSLRDVRAKTEKLKCWDGGREESWCKVRNGS